MPYAQAVRLGACASLVLVALFFSPTASVQQRDDSLLNRVAPASSTAPSKAGDTGGDDQVVVNTDLISFNVTVTDKSGRHISGLPQSAFTIFDEKRPQEISFFGEDDSPISVGVVFDLTASMTGGKVRHAREALAHFIETSHKDDEYDLVTLRGGEALLSLDRTHDSEAVTAALTGVAPRGATALYDGCYAALNNVLRGTYPRRAILLISDGRDNNSRHTFDELRRLVKESDVVIYTIGIPDEDSEHARLYGEDILEDLADISGGRFFQPHSGEEMYSAFERIALELRRQYAIGYKPANFTTDGKWHRVKVKIAPPPGSPRLSIRHRDGYYALTKSR
ncbi:MAG TPA: VWA domain-containing protein [Pyrinomonadaceae bacterium]|jgi:Ca-activated chloride channel family protein